jgi:hypothetical protein
MQRPSRTGGLLFVFEDVASFWTPTLGWQVFIACMTSGAFFARSVYCIIVGFSHVCTR